MHSREKWPQFARKSSGFLDGFSGARENPHFRLTPPFSPLPPSTVCQPRDGTVVILRYPRSPRQGTGMRPADAVAVTRACTYDFCIALQRGAQSGALSINRAYIIRIFHYPCGSAPPTPCERPYYERARYFLVILLKHNESLRENLPPLPLPPHPCVVVVDDEVARLSLMSRINGIP